MKIEQYLNLLVRKKIIVMGIAILLCAGLVYLAIKKTKSNNNKLLTYEVLGRAAVELEKIWIEAGDRADIRCHPLQMEQQFEKRPSLNFVSAGEKFSVEVLKFNSGKFTQAISSDQMRWHTTPFTAYKMKIRFNKKIATLFFNESCREIYLPQRRYGYGQISDENKLDWENDKNIFIDKFLVKNYDVKTWLAATHSKKELDQLVDKLKLANDSAPATFLSMKQMQAYCSFRGKQILTAQIRDAASFHPLRIEDKSFAGRGEYVWVKNKGLSFLFEAAHQKKEFKQNYCRFLVTEECSKLKEMDDAYIGTPSWVGLFNVLGGPMEYVRNPLDPQKNLEVSSFYFPVNSTWHQVGKRGYWDGEGHEFSNINWYGNSPRNESLDYQIGFRCMRYQYAVES